MSTESASHIETIQDFYGAEPKTSDWMLVEQSVIDQFAETTGDHNWIHVDVERSQRESPFGGTIAHGFWTLSMIANFAQQFQPNFFPDGSLYGLNYGLDRVRFMSPVRVGKRIRCIVQLIDIADRRRGRYLVKSEYKIELEDEQKPAMVAVWSIMVAFPYESSSPYESSGDGDPSE
jgi:acyl dehydratase